MFCAEVGSVRTTGLFIKGPSLFAGLVIAWLRATTLFANFAEAVAEGRGKARADTLRKARHDTLACLRRDDGSVAELPAAELHVGDICVVEAGRIIPGDGDVINGIATVDESAITGESAPVIRESGGDRSAVTGGTTVLSDRIEVRITSNPGETRLVLQVWTDHRSRRHARPQRDPSQGHRQGRDGRALRAAAQHGNSPGDDYR